MKKVFLLAILFLLPSQKLFADDWEDQFKTPMGKWVCVRGGDMRVLQIQSGGTRAIPCKVIYKNGPKIVEIFADDKKRGSCEKFADLYQLRLYEDEKFSCIGYEVWESPKPTLPSKPASPLPKKAK